MLVVSVDDFLELLGLLFILNVVALVFDFFIRNPLITVLYLWLCNCKLLNLYSIAGAGKKIPNVVDPQSYYHGRIHHHEERGVISAYDNGIKNS